MVDDSSRFDVLVMGMARVHVRGGRSQARKPSWEPLHLVLVAWTYIPQKIFQIVIANRVNEDVDGVVPRPAPILIVTYIKYSTYIVGFYIT